MNTATTERVLVKRCKAGDHAAFVELIQQSAPLARRAIRTIACNPADVDDVMQDTIVRAFQKVRSFNQRSKFSTWLTRIAINNALMLLRRQKGKREISLEIDSEDPKARSFQLTDNTLDPEQALIRHQSIEIIRNAVHALPRALRECAERRCFQELSDREAASSLRITLAAGKARYFRVRHRLRSSLLGSGPTPCSSFRDSRWEGDSGLILDGFRTVKLNLAVDGEGSKTFRVFVDWRFFFCL